MKKTFRPWDVSQGNLFPPAPKDLLPRRHLSHFIRDLVRDELDLSAIHAHYTELRGYPPYHGRAFQPEGVPWSASPDTGTG